MAQQNTDWEPYPVGTWVEFHDGKRTRRGRVRGILPPCMPTPVREDTEFYPGGYLVGSYIITPARGHLIRSLKRAAQ